jgi:hypothetical protein
MNGNLIGAVNTPTLASASGVWDIEELKLAQQQNTWPLFRQPDPDFEYVSLLLSSETASINGAQNNTFQDSSTNNFTITRNGNTTQGSFSPYLPNWSNNFDGTGDYLTVPYSASIAQWWDADFTIEMWVYNRTNAASSGNGTSLQVTYGTPTTTETYWAFGTQATGVLYFYYFNGGVVTNAFSTATVALNTWTHIAMVYNNTTGTIKGYISGIEVFSVAKQGTPQAASGRTFNIGISQNTTYNGYISNLRVVRGSLVYTGNFTPSTTPLTAVTNTSLLVAQSNRFIDNSTNNFTITINGDTRITPFSPFSSFVATKGYVPATYGGSGYFDGTGDYLSAAVSTTLNVTANTDFTVEGWCYLNSRVATRPAIFSNYNSFTTGGLSFWAGHGSSTITQFQVGLNGTFPALNAGTIPYNSWFHWAIVRNGTGSNNITVYINGTSIGTISSNVAITSAGNTLWLGASGDATANAGINGYMSNFRWVKDTAVYTSAFTPPTAPLTAITNTSLLTNFTNGGIIDSAAFNNTETVGNAQVSTSVKNYGSGSYYFDGTGDWCTIIDKPELRFGTGAFTVEFWLYLGATGAARGIIGKGTASTGWLISTNSSNNVVFTYSSSTITSAGALSSSTWYFITVVRQSTGSNQTKIYINGINDGTGTVSTDFTQTNIMYVGADRTGGDGLNGYISDLRLTNGLARYTTNFTPPIASLPTF